MEYFNLEEVIKNEVKTVISEKIQEEIDEEVIKFRNKLMHRKDDYIAEVMKGIRIFHERDINSLGMNYKVIFENIYRVEDKRDN